MYLAVQARAREAQNAARSTNLNDFAEQMDNSPDGTLDPKLYDVTTGAAEDRGPDYEEPEFSAPEKKILNDNYTVII